MSSIGRSFGFSARLLRALQVRHDLVPWSPHVAEVLREHAKRPATRGSTNGVRTNSSWCSSMVTVAPSSVLAIPCKWW